MSPEVSGYCESMLAVGTQACSTMAEAAGKNERQTVVTSPGCTWLNTRDKATPSSSDTVIPCPNTGLNEQIESPSASKPLGKSATDSTQCRYCSPNLKPATSVTGCILKRSANSAYSG